MHALFVTPAFPPFPGGGERYARSLALNLAQRGVKVTVATTFATRESDLWQPSHNAQGGTKIEHDGALTIVRCPNGSMPFGFNGLLAWRKIMVLLSSLPGNQKGLLAKMSHRVPNIPLLKNALEYIDQPVDIVHGFNLSWEGALLEGWRYAGRYRLPFVATPFLHTGASGRDRVSRNTTMDHQIDIVKNSSAIFTLTRNEKQSLTNLGVNSRRISNVGSGLDSLPNISDSDLNWVDSLIDDPFVLFIGRNSYDKGCQHAVQALLALKDEFRNLKLLVAGQITKEFKNFYESLSELNKDRIVILGVVSENHKHALLEKALLLLLPSRTDSFGIVILEAWAHGKPVIGARAGGIASVISDGDDGFLIEFGDVDSLTKKIKVLIQNPELRELFARKGRSKLNDQFNWDHVGQLVLGVYQQITGQVL